MVLAMGFSMLMTAAKYLYTGHPLLSNLLQFQRTFKVPCDFQRLPKGSVCLISS